MGGVNCRNCKCNKDFDDDFEKELNGKNGKKEDEYIYDNNLTIINCNIGKKDDSILNDKNQIINKKTNEATIQNNNIDTIEVNNENNKKFYNKLVDTNLIKNNINNIEEDDKNQNNLQTDEAINLKNIINLNLNNQIELNNNNKNNNINQDLIEEKNIEMNNDNYILSEMNIENENNNNPDYLLEEKEKIIKNKNLNNILDENSGNINISNPENTNLFKNNSLSIIKNKENYINNSNSKIFSNNNITNNTINNISTNTNNNNITNNNNNTIKIQKKNHKKIITKLTKSNRSSSQNQNNLLRKRAISPKGKTYKNQNKNESSDININSKYKYIYEYDIGNIEFGINIEEEDLSTGEQKLYEEAQKNLEQFYPPEKNEIKNLQKLLQQISLRNILTKEKLINISRNEDAIIFHSELNKLINYEVNAHTKMYSSRFCIITSNYFKYYKSKAQFLRNLNPLCIISFKHILRVNFAKINRTSPNIDHIIICNKRGVFRNNNSIIGHKFDNVESNSFISNPENNESLLIFSSDDLQIVYKWFLLFQFMLERNKKNDTINNENNRY